jgi:hypothetical protein
MQWKGHYKSLFLKAFWKLDFGDYVTHAFELFSLKSLLMVALSNSLLLFEIHSS